MNRTATPCLCILALVSSWGVNAHAQALPSIIENDDALIRASKARGLAVVVNQAACGGGSYSVVNAPDGSSISILFDNFTVASTPNPAAIVRASCAVTIPLDLPPGYSLGVFAMDYRGFAHLNAGQSSQLTIDHSAGRRGHGRRLRSGLRGNFEGDFGSSENIGTGITRRAGCGDVAALNLTATLELRPNGYPQEAMVTLDTADGAARRGVVFHIDLKKCKT